MRRNGDIFGLLAALNRALRVVLWLFVKLSRTREWLVTTDVARRKVACARKACIDQYSAFVLQTDPLWVRRTLSMLEAGCSLRCLSPDVLVCLCGLGVTLLDS
jgi:hypothetical protein